MGLKQVLKKSFSDPKTISSNRYYAAKFVFICTALLFFLNTFLLLADFYTEVFSITWQYTYFIFMVALFSYMYFSIKKYTFGKIPGPILFILGFLLFLVFLFSIFTVNGGVTYLLTQIQNV